MILIFFLCLKLSILHLCVCDHGYQCYSNTIKGYSSNIEIYLVQENHSDVASVYQQKINNAFELYCQDYYEIHKGPLKQGILSFNNIVHFAVPDYYDGKPLNDFVYAGNVSKNYNADCTIKTNNKELANLVSTSVYKMNDGHLYNFVQALDYKDETYVELTTTTSCEPLRNTSDLTVVILCLRGVGYFSDREINLKDLKLIQVPEYKCPVYLDRTDVYLVNPDLQYYLKDRHLNWLPESQEMINNPWNLFEYGLQDHYKYKNRLLAVLAPVPYQIIFDSLVPTIFYETPYLYSETKADLPNSMNLVPWRLLKYGFLKFIQTVGWQRVAIVSDDSEYSVAFEDELTALFRKEKGIIHTVIRCEHANCNMGKITQELNAAAAWIIIANVKEKNARYLIKNTNKWFTWLLRDVTETFKANREVPYFYKLARLPAPFVEITADAVFGKKADNGVGNLAYRVPADHIAAFSFTLDVHTKTKGCDLEDNILTGLSGIAQAYENTKKYASILKKREFYRYFTDELQRVTSRITEAEIVVKRISGSDNEEISRMSVNTNGVTKIDYKNPFPKEPPNDGTARCLVTTNDYYKPCDDPMVLLFMFTLMLFVLTILLITCYFDKTSPFNDIRYQHF